MSGIAALIAACSSNSASPGGGASDAEAPEDSGNPPPVADSGSETSAPSSDASVALVTGLVADASNYTAAKNFDATQYPAVQGVKVCVYGDSSVPCALTDANGKYTLAVPVGAAVTLSYDKAGYTPYLYAVAAQSAGATDNAPALLITTTAAGNAFLTMAGGTPDPTKGVILFGGGTIGPSPGAMYHEMFGAYDYYYAPGYSVAVSPATTVGPVYVSAAWAPDPSLTASSVAGWGVIQAPPGKYTLTYSALDLSCGSTTATIVAGYTTTYVGVACGVVDGGAPAGDASTDTGTPASDASTDTGTPAGDASPDAGTSISDASTGG
jgi:hypothetical protein